MRLALICLLLAGCTTAPVKCPTVAAHQFQARGETYYVLDVSALQALWDHATGKANGTCE